MAPTLQDVSFLLGLPLAGAGIGPFDAPVGWREAMRGRFAHAFAGVEFASNDPPSLFESPNENLPRRN